MIIQLRQSVKFENNYQIKTMRVLPWNKVELVRETEMWTTKLNTVFSEHCSLAAIQKTMKVTCQAQLGFT